MSKRELIIVTEALNAIHSCLRQSEHPYSNLDTLAQNITQLNELIEEPEKRKPLIMTSDNLNTLAELIKTL